MKKRRRFLALLMAMVMLFSTFTSAFAEAEQEPVAAEVIEQGSADEGGVDVKMENQNEDGNAAASTEERTAEDAAGNIEEETQPEIEDEPEADQEREDESLPETDAEDAGAEVLDEKKDDNEVTAEEIAPVGAGNLTQLELVELTDFSWRSTTDGTPVWDVGSGNTPGNDENASNGVVRTFDDVSYIFGYSAKVKDGLVDDQDNTISTVEQLKVQFEAFLPGLTMADAKFDLSAMNWLENASQEEVGGGVKVTGTRTTNYAGGKSTMSETLSVVVNVLGMENGMAADGTPKASLTDKQQVQPTVKIWLDGDTAGETEKRIEPNENTRVVVSAYPRYNLKLARNEYCAYKDTFDFSTGNANAVNSDVGVVTGRMYGYAVSVQLYGNPEKKYKGIELPTGPITYDIDLKMEKTTGGGAVEDITAECTPLLWDYNTNPAPSMTNGQEGRKLTWLPLSHQATLAAPYAGEVTKNSLQNTYGNTIQASQSGSTISVAVDKYSFYSALYGYRFPTQNASSTAASQNYDNSYQGVFAVGYMQILAPFPETVLEESSYYLTVSDTNFKATSITGQVSTEQVPVQPADDSLRLQVYISMSGSYSKGQFYDNSNRNYLSGSNYTYGANAALPGTDLYLETTMRPSANNDKEQDVYSFNILNKFDDEALEVLEGLVVTQSLGGMTAKIVYAANKNYPNGWKGNEDALLLATEEDFIYFDSLTELMGAGYTCTAYLAEVRSNGTARITADVSAKIYQGVHVKETAEVNKVYIQQCREQIWHKEHCMDASYTATDSSKVIPVPDATLYRGSVANQKYIKAAYSNDNQIISGTHSLSYEWGNSLLIIGAKAGISKTQDQRVGNQAKVTYNLDAGQRYVDYVITPSLTLDGKTSTVQGTTSVTITDTLPKGLAYVDGSSYLGGTYTTTDVGTASGTITEGRLIEPDSVTEKSTGETIIKWTIQGVTPGEAIDAIHFKALIGDMEDFDKDVKQGDQFNNKASITSPIDHRVIDTSNGNTTSSGISVIKLGGASFAKSADQPVVDPAGKVVSYTLSYTNSTTLPMDNVTIFDVIPYTGDGRGTFFNGTLMVDKIKVDLSKASGTTTSSIYTTKEESAKTLKAATATLTDPIFTKTVLNSGGTATVGETLTAFAWKGNIAPGETVKVQLIMNAQQTGGGDLKAGTIFYNNATSYDGATSLVTPPSVTGVPERTLSGTIWLDADRDGSINNGEAVISGVKVTLWVWSETEKKYILLEKDEAGNDMKPVITDQSGYYEFKKLPAGKFKVTVESGDVENGGKDISYHEVSTSTYLAAGETIVSDTHADGYLLSGGIDGIIMDTASTMKSRIDNKTNRNVGLILEEVNVDYQWVSTDNPTDVNPPDSDTINKGDAYNSTAQESTSQKYVFDGWYTDSGCNTKYTEGTKLTEDTTLYGKWTAQVDITYQWAGDEKPSDVTPPTKDTIDKGKTYDSKDQDPTAEQYRFEGWYTDEECTKSYVDGSTIDTDTILYGKWTPFIEVKYQWVGTDHPSDVSVPTKDTIDKGSAYTSKGQEATSQGYTFAGWYLDKDCKILYTNGTKLDKDTVLYGKWTKDTKVTNIKVTYEWVGTRKPTDVSKPTGDTIAKGTAYTSKTQAATKQKLTFQGWYLDKECTIPYEDGTVLTEDTVLYGKWKPKTDQMPETDTNIEPGKPGYDFVKGTAKTTVKAGEKVAYTFGKFGNNSGQSLNEFTILDTPDKGLDFIAAALPAFTNGTGVTYDVIYHTSAGKRVVLHEDVAADEAFSFSMPSLDTNEYVTGITFAFGTVPAGFGVGDTISLTFKVWGNPPTTTLTNEAILSYKVDGESKYKKSSVTVNVGKNSTVAGVSRGAGSGSSKTKTSVKTGDDTNVALFGVMAVLGLLGAGVVLRGRKRREEEI